MGFALSNVAATTLLTHPWRLEGCRTVAANLALYV